MANTKMKINSLYSEGSAYNIIQELSIGFQKSQILFTAVELDIFTVLGDNEKTAQDIASIINVNSKYLERLLDALVAVRLLDKRIYCYKNTELSLEHLVKTSPNYYGFLLHNADLWKSWGTLTSVIRTGKFETTKKVSEKDEQWITDLLASLDWRAKLEIDTVIKLFPIKNSTKMLDLGAGSGRYALESAKQNSKINAYIFDYPNVVEISEKMIRKEYTGNNIHFLSGDITVDDLGQDYDFVYIGAVLHDYSVLENIEILSKVYKSIRRGGQAIIHQQLIDDARISPITATLEAVNLMVNTPAGNSYTHADIWVTLKESGFGNIEFFKTDFNTQIVIANKSLIG